MSEIDNLIEGYWRWLRDKTTVNKTKDWFEITTPYLDRHNDYVQIYAKKVGDEFVLTDDGQTILDLEHSGCSLDSPKRKSILKTVLNGFGVDLKGNEILTHATYDNFALRKHSLLQAVLAVNDMFYLASPTVEAMFFEDVAAWLDLAEVRYTPRVKFAGKTGFDHMFDFVIPKSRREPERIIRAVNNPNRETALSFVTSWLETRETRSEESVAYAFLNDNDRTVSGSITEALSRYSIRPILWSAREKIKDTLAA